MHNNPHLTIKDIAKLAGVSKSTVSRVINNEKGVSLATQKKIQDVIVKYQFTPSVSARGLKGYNRSVIAVIVTRLTSYSENLALKSILSVCEKRNIDVLVLESQFNSAIFNQHLSMLYSRQVNGIIAFSFSNLNIEQEKRWQNRIVFISQKVANFISITYDNKGAIEQLYQIYCEKFNHIAYIGIDDKDLSTGKERNQHYLYLSKKAHKKPYIYYANLSMIFNSGYEQAKILFKEHSYIQVIICATDSIALGVCKFCRENNHDVKIAYIGHNAMLDFLFPLLDCVNLNVGHSGKLALEQLIKLIEAPDNPTNYDQILMQHCTLISYDR